MTDDARTSIARELRERRRARFTETGEGARIIRAGQDVTAQVRAEAALPRPTHAAPTQVQ